MNYRGGHKNVHKFIGSFLAMAYFRIVGFKEKLLECLKQKSFDGIPEWRNAEGDLDK